MAKCHIKSESGRMMKNNEQETTDNFTKCVAFFKRPTERAKRRIMLLRSHWSHESTKLQNFLHSTNSKSKKCCLAAKRTACNSIPFRCIHTQASQKNGTQCAAYTHQSDTRSAIPLSSIFTLLFIAIWNKGSSKMMVILAHELVLFWFKQKLQIYF